MDLTFSLSELNKKSPYVLESDGMYSFSFVTEQGKKYEIGFIQDLMISDEGFYQFFITTEDQFKTVLDKKIQEELKITTERGKENVNLFSNIEGVNAWCSVTEDPKDHCWRISIRSKETPINEVAAKWEGGGHAQASGAKIDNLEQLPAFINDLDQLFK